MIWGASNFSSTVDHLTMILLIISAALVLTVFSAVTYFCIKYRKDSPASRENPIEKPRWWELGIASLIFIFGLGIFIWSSVIYYHMYTPPQDSREIYVVGKQWMWIFHDPKGKDQINTLRVPLGVPVRLIMTSEDAIHSFYIPDFRLKQDLVPGIYTSLWFTAEKLGRFPILCAEYCGLDHSRMRATLEVVPKEEFEHPTGSSPQSLVESGKKLFQEKGCVACHTAEHPIGPSLTGLFGQKVKLSDGRSVVADENYIRKSILSPQADLVQGYPPAMPTFQGQITEDELSALIAYIKTKKE